MPDRVCTRYRDIDGLDVGCHLITKEYMIENYPSLVDQAKIPGLWTWGGGSDGQLGDNTDQINAASPVQTISGGSTWKSVSAGRSRVAAIKTDGTLWTWGDGLLGALGNNSSISRSSPVQTVSGGTDWRSVSAGGCAATFNHMAAIKTDGTLWTWGYGGLGQLGNNATTTRSSPVQTISGGNTWKSMSAGGNHTAATKIDGTLWMWGYGTQGQLGNNATIARSSPVQTISGGTNWRSVSAGSSHTAAIKTDGTLWTWGLGSYGRLGNNSTLNRSSPVQTISGGDTWRSVSGGAFTMAATKTDGTLWTWGNGFGGRLGNNLTTNQSSPVQTVSGGTNWRSVSVGGFHSVATKTDGTLWSWGSADAMGDYSNTARSSPVQTVSGGTNWRLASAGDCHSAAIKDLGDF
jgi:alpha-tubulin suppressor-like RCC1 family protein